MGMGIWMFKRQCVECSLAPRDVLFVAVARVCACEYKELSKALDWHADAPSNAAIQETIQSVLLILTYECLEAFLCFSS